MKKSAGILLYRSVDNIIEVLLVHPGGPFWKNKDDGVWSIPKGEFTGEEDALTAAKRELKEEINIDCDGPFIELLPVKQKSGKMVYAWAAKKDIDASKILSNHFDLEWPPRSGKYMSVPEVDRAAWFSAEQAKKKIMPSQSSLIDDLFDKLVVDE